jgi:amino acid permease
MSQDVVTARPKLYGTISNISDDDDESGTVRKFDQNYLPRRNTGVSSGDASLASSDTSHVPLLVLDEEATGDTSVRFAQVGQATIASEVANITKNLLGSASLSFSEGIAIYSNDPRNALYSAFAWIVILGIIFGFFCVLIAKICQRTGARTYRECWELTMGGGAEQGGALAVSLVYALLPALGNLAYSAILSQTLQSLLETAGIFVTRVEALLVVTVVAILPLCLLKNLHVLAPFSALGTAGMMFTALVMVIRCRDGTYQPGGIYYNDLIPQFQPHFGTKLHAWSKSILPFICMVFEAWVMHYNSPRFYNELKNATIPRYSQAVSVAFGSSGLLYMVIAGAGFLTFGEHSDGYIINNYSSQDPLITVSRLGIALSTLTIYPVAFVGFRDGVLDCLNIPRVEHTDARLNGMTVILLTLLTVIAIFFSDLGLINAFAGGTLATAVCFVFPAVMYRQTIIMEQRGKSNLEAQIAMVLMSVGSILGLIGVWQAVVATYGV